jgi:hypothetical protein
MLKKTYLIIRVRPAVVLLASLKGIYYFFLVLLPTP